MTYININGKITTPDTAGIPVDNGAFRYGYGLFETMLVRDNVIRLKEYHWQRLFEDSKKLYFDLKALMTPDELETEVMKTVKKNGLEKLCRVRLQFFASGGGLYGLETSRPGFLIECFPLNETTLQLNTNGLTIGIAEGYNKSVDSLSNIKSCNALIYALAARQAKANKWNDALICNTYGNIIESTIANIFWIHDGIIYTPPLSDGCIAGVMRRHIISITEVKEKSLTSLDLFQAQEVFLTNSIKSISWVSDIGNQRLEQKTIKCIFDIV
jgi:branched-chain amino acid aminotransferase